MKDTAAIRKKCFKWAWAVLCIYIPCSVIFAPMGNAPPAEEAVFVSVSLISLGFIMACSWRAMKLKTKARYFALLFLIYGLLNSLMFLHQILQ